MPNSFSGLTALGGGNYSTSLSQFKDKDFGMGNRRHSEHCCLALFAYEHTGDPRQWFKDELPARCRHASAIVNLISVGCSSFVKWWKYSPHGGDAHYENWHSYKLERMSAGYFIANLIDEVSPDPVGLDERFWYPSDQRNMIVWTIFPLVSPR